MIRIPEIFVEGRRGLKKSNPSKGIKEKLLAQYHFRLRTGTDGEGERRRKSCQKAKGKSRRSKRQYHSGRGIHVQRKKVRIRDASSVPEIRGNSGPDPNPLIRKEGGLSFLVRRYLEGREVFVSEKSSKRLGNSEATALRFVLAVARRWGADGGKVRAYTLQRGESVRSGRWNKSPSSVLKKETQLRSTQSGAGGELPF